MLNFKIDKHKKLILIGGAILLLFGLVYRLLPLFDNMQSGSAEIVLKERQLAKYRQIIQEGNDLEARLVSLKRGLNRAEAGLLSGQTPSLAAVDIQNILSEIADTTDVQVKTVRVLKPGGLDEEGYQSIPVEFTISSTIRQLKGLLYRIETCPKYLTVKKIRISVSRSRSRSRKGSRPQFQSHITIAGYMKKANKVKAES